jgi:hypothetical protein
MAEPVKAELTSEPSNEPAIYAAHPAGLTAHIQYLLAALLVGINVIAYGRWFLRGRKSQTNP